MGPTETEEYILKAIKDAKEPKAKESSKISK
jgi:hypothetical protein